MNTETTAPHIPVQEVESSQIHAIGHDPVTNTLAIRFKNRASDAPTSLYHYANFTAEDFAAFRDAESIGSHFRKHIKPYDKKHPYTKVEDAPAAES
ncbi:KTSC domain-containing protein [Burkholderia cenocepacia]|uniref:KTSC domain-containing protein n=1 Tax=Burkholderia cenocepacia TaxID=95486 RepID=A0A1V2W3L5_9BURK|nr:KTSC domain-containing protein [Burkholderia cenocepacia]MBR8248654.1 KTSC domain-containing protein [Burkholderia cenocepacia]MBR8288828.1 KTSC domain-containing protein [Burkholderia cenocepacia]MBR8497097.1 KTSC domain-containing protein [Burkholderia cenocepacia]ONJ13668.1 KTSC domain-containing protein [Burkholderia cenocepacia]ONJ30228.1 KTSC domain-containing protein [Burkholderia cenocepacia]